MTTAVLTDNVRLWTELVAIVLEQDGVNLSTADWDARVIGGQTVAPHRESGVLVIDGEPLFSERWR